jgi:hypothetical protein
MWFEDSRVANDTPKAIDVSLPERHTNRTTELVKCHCCKTKRKNTQQHWFLYTNIQ